MAGTVLIVDTNPAKSGGGRLTGASAIRLHATLAAGLALCLAAGAYELSRALEGNMLSWAYVFEWPLFGAFGIYLWWKLLHEDQPGSDRSKVSGPMSTEDQEQLEEWNRYLAELHASESDRPEDGPQRPRTSG